MALYIELNSTVLLGLASRGTWGLSVGWLQSLQLQSTDHSVLLSVDQTKTVLHRVLVLHCINWDRKLPVSVVMEVK